MHTHSQIKEHTLTLSPSLPVSQSLIFKLVSLGTNMFNVPDNLFFVLRNLLSKVHGI